EEGGPAIPREPPGGGAIAGVVLPGACGGGDSGDAGGSIALMTSSGIDLSFLPRSGSGIGGSIAAITSIGIDLSDSASTAAGLGASISATTPNGSDRFIDSAWSGAVRTGGRRPSGGGDTIAWVGMLGPAAGTRGCGRGGKDGGDGFCSSSGGGRSASGGLVFGLGTVLATSSAT